MKTNKRFKNPLLLLLCFVLIAAMALLAGCDNKNEEDLSSITSSNTSTATVLGEGEKEFLFTVVDAEGKETEFIINTNEKTVGKALMDLELINGEDSTYGLYVKTVNGITLDYDKDGKYWAFYINGQYASSGVEKTDIEPDSKYMFKAE